MRTWMALFTASLAAGCGGIFNRPPEGAPVAAADGHAATELPFVRLPAEPSVHDHPIPVRTPPRIMSFWVPAHVWRDRLIGGHTLDIEVEPAKWWTEEAEARARRPRREPPMSGTLKDEDLPRHLSTALRGAVIPYREQTSP